eukprot:3636773-Rhodomonas_salina.1
MSSGVDSEEQQAATASETPVTQKAQAITTPTPAPRQSEAWIYKVQWEELASRNILAAIQRKGQKPPLPDGLSLAVQAGAGHVVVVPMSVRINKKTASCIPYTIEGGLLSMAMNSWPGNDSIGATCCCLAKSGLASYCLQAPAWKGRHIFPS